MNLIKRHMLHPISSRHNRVGRYALFTILAATLWAAIDALLELESIREISESDKAMIAELILVVEGKAKLVERSGKYEVHYSVNKTTYEVK